MIQRPLIGIGVIIRRDGKILLGKRRNAHGAGSWCCPGGHLEYGESFAACARREVREETGLEIENIRCGTFTNDLFVEEDKHYVTLFMLADCPRGNPRVREPEKCERWAWFSEKALPRPLFLPLKNLLEEGIPLFTDTA
ncbi:MAG: NUDIX domain-containing protein [Desulfobacterales bacterium]|nr:NUDIX domain-containing protein [Desulfobacterales bacterium]